jgi:uridine kinase
MDAHDTSRHPVLIIGVAGGTGSGKTTIVRRLVEALGPDQVTRVEQDRYYRDLSAMPLDARGARNFDHPDSFEFDLLLTHIEQLAAGRDVDAPRYDFRRHVREETTDHLPARPAIIVEGILVLADPRLRELMNVRVYVDTDDDIRFIRRLQRDIVERGRTVESVISQYETTVKPMHLEFVEPSKRYAHVIVPEGGYNDVAVEMLLRLVRHHGVPAGRPM